MSEPSREEKIAAVRHEIQVQEEAGYEEKPHLRRTLDVFRAILRDLEAGGWRPMSEYPTEPVGVEFYHGNWPGPPEKHDHLRRSHGYWDGQSWRDDGTNHEIFEIPDDVLDHPTHYRVLPSPPTTSEGGEG